MKSLKVLGLAISMSLTSIAFAADYEWTVEKEWSPAYERKFAEFVTTIGTSKCATMDACLKSPTANPLYYKRTPKGRTFQADCADMPYALRMYFSWMEGLTFDYVNSVQLAEPSKESSGDLRYSRFGNKPKTRKSFEMGETYDAYEALTALRDSVSTAQYRMHYNFVSDFYPSKINRANIVPGAIVYDPAGHAAMVYQVEKDGRIRLMDAHPDNSVTRITYDEKFVRSRPAHGAGLRRWRPELSELPTNQMPDFSIDQFNASYSNNSEPVSYYEWVRIQLAGGQFKFKPVEEFRNQMTEICSAIQDRAKSVEAAQKGGIQAVDHPTLLPVNIYGTDGEWESFSTPSRDARLKVSFHELRKTAEMYISLYDSKNSKIEYTPKPSQFSQKCRANDGRCFLVSELQSIYADLSSKPECGVEYTKTDGTKKKLSYSDIETRLFALSFDPYHCVELRWGASQASELATCADQSAKLKWYVNEQGLRNQLDRTYGTKMDVDVNGASALGVPQAPDVNVWKFLESLFATS